MPIPTLQGLEGRFIHKVSVSNMLSPGGMGGGDNAIWLPIEPGGSRRTSSTTLPQLIVDGVNSSEMQWDPAAVVAGSGTPGGWVTLDPSNEHPYWGRVTTVHNLIRQINQRQGIGALDSDAIVARADLIDQADALIWTFVPGATGILAQPNFPLFFDDDQDGLIEPRAVRLTLRTTHTPLPGVDGGRIVLRLNNLGLDEAPAW